MKTIYWSLYKREDGKVLANALYSEGEYAMNADGSLFNEPYETVAQAVLDITQIRKPAYYQLHGAGYELKYVEPDSEIWQEMVAKWGRFNVYMHNLISKFEESQKPWYVRLLNKVKGILN